MKKLSILCMVSAFAFILISSCNKSFLNTKPLTTFSEQDVWGDPVLEQLYVNNLYNQLSWGWSESGMVDESRSRGDVDDFKINNMLITSDDAGRGGWGVSYTSIRACNIFLENIDKFPSTTTLIDGKTINDRLKGEVTFLRALYFHNLVSYFGGVPLITKSYSLTDDFTAARATYADCVKFITDECDIAASLLPVVNTGNAVGRATKGAALALKSRVLLYAASDQHNTDKFSDFSNPELLGYTSGSQANRWKAARDAAKAVIDLNMYSLYKPDPASGREASQNYEDLFVSKKSVEDIFVRFFNASLDKGFRGWTLTPNGWYGNGLVGAINELVDDYEMSDGTRFSRSIPKQALEPYTNRDPRFYGTLLYEGAKWRARPSDLVGIDPAGVLQVGYWETWNNATSKIVNIWGLDSKNSIVNSWNSNSTGTIIHKTLDRTVDIQASDQDLTWRYFRYGEILLNYAEACNELGEDVEARTYLNKIRKRAFMPDIIESGDALRAHIRNERRVEMAFEGQRLFDVRRWLMGPAAYHGVHGVTVVYKLNTDHTTATIPTITPVQIMTGSWDDKAYFFPIARDEVNKNSLLVQNPGY